MIRSLLIIAIFSLNPVAASAYEFDFNPECQKAYNEILKLRFDNGYEILQNEKNKHPENLIPYFVENYIDFITIFVNENDEEFGVLKSNKEERLKRIKQGPKESPYYLYSQAEVHLQWAFARLKFEEYVTAAWEIRKAFKLLEENQVNFPEFIANKKGLGLLHSLIGTLPEKYKWIFDIIGLEGTVKQGMDELVEIVTYARTNPFIFKDETLILYTFLTLYLENNETDAWEVIQSERISTTDNLLNIFVAANIAMKTGHNDKAITILSTRPSGEGYFQFPYLDYMLGLAKLRRLDNDASDHFFKYLDNFRGQNYIKDTYQKLAWGSLLDDDLMQYKKYMLICKNSGEIIVDADNHAYNEAIKRAPPNTHLLKSRLLCDGGYYKEALKSLSGLSVDDFDNLRDKLEFTYRAGRIYHQWEKKEKAIGYYLATVKNGKEYPYYYAANSALQLGIIYEEKAETEKARYYYNLCISMKDHEYKNSINQKAKAGLSRLKNK